MQRKRAWLGIVERDGIGTGVRVRVRARRGRREGAGPGEAQQGICKLGQTWRRSYEWGARRKGVRLKRCNK